MRDRKKKREHSNIPYYTDYPIPEKCNYCGSPVIFISVPNWGKKSGAYYRCTKCDACVGVHKGTRIPLGRLADKETRQLRQECHRYFDMVWKGKPSPNSRRTIAYEHLAKILKMDADKCHFGNMSIGQLEKALFYLKKGDWFTEEDYLKRKKSYMYSGGRYY